MKALFSFLSNNSLLNCSNKSLSEILVNRFSFSNKRNFGTLFFLVSIFLFNALNSHSQTLTFDFTGIVGSEVSSNSNFNHANLNASTITRGAGLAAAANGDRFNATSWNATSIASAIAGNDYMEFTITPQAGFQFTISSITMQVQRSATGMSSLALRSNLDAFGSDLDAIKAVVDNTTTQSFTFTFAQSPACDVPIIYRLYAVAEATTGTGGPGDGAGNDIVVNGTVTACGGCVPDAEPTTNATGISSTPGCNSAIINFTRSTTATNSLVVVSTDDCSGGSFTDPSDQTNYTPNTVYGSGGLVGANERVVYSSTGNSVTVTGLSASTTYYYKIYSYNGISANCTENYLLSASCNSFTTGIAAEPTTNASAITATPGCKTASIDFTGGNGANVIAVLSTNCTITDPVDVTGYTANMIFGSGNTTGAGDFVVYNGAASSFSISGLTQNTSYCLKIYEYNGTTANCDENYFITGVSSTSFTTLNAGCLVPRITSVLVNSCEATCQEGDNEIIFGTTGDLSFVASSANLDLFYDGGNPASTNYVDNLTTVPATTTDLNTAAGCPGLFVEGTGATIPAGAKFMVVKSTMCEEAYTWSSLCGSGPIYVIYSTDATWVSGGNFVNGGAVTRYFRSTITATDASVTTIDYNYNAASLVGANGSSVIYASTGGAPTSYFNNGCTLDPILLPIEWKSFEVESKNNTANLIWETYSERNNDYFEIEIANQFDTDFKTIGKVKGNGSTSEESSYSFLAENLKDGYYYFRLKQVDFDGKSSYSEIKTATIAGNGLAIIKIQKDIDYSKLTFNQTISQGSTFEVFEITGKKVFSQEITEPSKSIEINQRLSGMLIFKIQHTTKGTEVFRMILQDF